MKWQAMQYYCIQCAFSAHGLEVRVISRKKMIQHLIWHICAVFHIHQLRLSWNIPEHNFLHLSCMLYDVVMFPYFISLYPCASRTSDAVNARLHQPFPAAPNHCSPYRTSECTQLMSYQNSPPSESPIKTRQSGAALNIQSDAVERLQLLSPGAGIWAGVIARMLTWSHAPHMLSHGAPVLLEVLVCSEMLWSADDCELMWYFQPLRKGLVI